MMKNISERLLAATVFVTTLGGTLAILPLVQDNPALALEASGPVDHRHQMPLPSERVEARIAYVRTALQITDAQAKLWATVADVMRKHAKAHDAEIEALRDQQRPDVLPSLIDLMERHEKMLAAHAAQLEEMIAVAKPLYASLSPEQKKAADTLLPFGPGHEGHFAHGPEHMMPPGPAGEPLPE